MNTKQLIAPIIFISILLSGCATKTTPKVHTTYEYKLGHYDGYNTAINHHHNLINRMIDFTNYSYHTNLTPPKPEKNKTREYQRGFINGWKASKARKFISFSIIHSPTPIIIEHDGTADGIIVPDINHITIPKPPKKPKQKKDLF